MPISDDDKQRIKEALFQGKKIEAIKLWREVTGVGLAEAKTAVEAIEAELRVAFPERFTAAPAKSGCAGAVLAVVLLLAALSFLAWAR